MSTPYPVDLAVPVDFDGIDVIALTHGHLDHIADVVRLAKKHTPTVVAMVERDRRQR